MQRSWAIATAILALAATAAAQPPAFTTIDGMAGPGALYEIALPTAPWNGELVIFVHGIGVPDAPVTLPAAVAPLRQAVTSQGFALAYSSFSHNGYAAVRDGLQRTHQLRGIFASIVGEPARVYLVGNSLGGLIATVLAERFPTQYDGALINSGLLAGGLEELQYIADARILFEYFFPGIVPGAPFYVPPGIDFSPGGPTYQAALQALTQGLSSPKAETAQFAGAARLPFKSPAEMVKAGMNVVGFAVTHTDNLMDFTNGRIPYDNTATVYSLKEDQVSPGDAALNEGVQRYASDPVAWRYMERYYTPTGDLHFPVLTLHATRDPIVPIRHEQDYAEAVANAGVSQYLLQRSFDLFGHGTIPDADVLAGFSALVEWVRTGVKPAQ